jgi:hypothetical protein
VGATASSPAHVRARFCLRIDRRQCRGSVLKYGVPPSKTSPSPALYKTVTMRG